MSVKRLTIRDIAKMTGVSYATVSRALSGSAGIGKDTRRRIIEVCNQLGYTTNYMARSLVVRKSRLIGLIVGSIDNPYMAQLACEAELYARRKGYSMILCNSTSRVQHEAELFSLLIGRQVDGIIFMPANSGSYAALEKYFAQIPMVIIGDTPGDSRRSYVTVDNYQGTFLGAEYLISLGHRSIVYIGHRPGSVTHLTRIDGYVHACESHGIKPAVIENPEPFSSIEHGYILAKKLFSSSHPYTAIFAATDTTALGVMKAADETGIRIPEDISLIGFDNISFSMLPRINLTTIEQPFNTMAASAVDMLIHIIEDPAAGYSHTILSPSLVKRGTCRSLIR